MKKRSLRPLFLWYLYIMESVRKLVREVLSEILDRTDVYTSFMAAKKHLDKNNLYLHFTNVYKLGINPQKTHADPHAVYFYPAKWILNEDNWKMFQYAVTMDYFFLAQVDTSNFLHIPSITKQKADRIMKDVGLYDMWEKYGKDFDSNPPRKFWEFLDMLNVEPGKRNNEDHNSLPHIKWNAFFKETGYDGFIDDKGIVNDGEPHQIGVFNQSTIKVLESGENKDIKSEYMKFYKDVIKEFNIDVREQGYIHNGKEYRIYGLVDGSAIDIRIQPDEYMAHVFYSDDAGNVYKIQSERAFESQPGRRSVMSTIKSAIENAENPVVNLDRIRYMKNAARTIFKHVNDYNFKSFKYGKKPMIYRIDNDKYGQADFTGGLHYDEEGQLIVDFTFLVNSDILIGEPLEIFSRIVDENPDGGEKQWYAELEKLGIDSSTFEYKNKDDIESPIFRVKKAVKDPEGALTSIQADFEDWIASYNWPPPNKDAKLKSQRMAPEQKVRMWFYDNINKG